MHWALCLGDDGAAAAPNSFDAASADALTVHSRGRVKCSGRTNCSLLLSLSPFPSLSPVSLVLIKQTELPSPFLFLTVTLDDRQTIQNSAAVAEGAERKAGL